MTRRRLRLLARAVASVAVVLSLHAPSPAAATPTFELERVAGNDRYATAAALALEGWTSSTSAVIATGDSFPDALAGSFIAGYINAPILLVRRTEVPAATRDALTELGVTEVALLGGPAAISDEVEASLDEGPDAGLDVVRLAGSDRFATAANIALAVNPADIGELNGMRTAFLANGYTYADALAAGPLANAARLPVLLTGSAGLGSPARTALERLQIEHVVIVGGDAAISPGTVEELDALDISSERLAGQDRFATAAAVADFAIDELEFVPDHVDLAKGVDPADARQGFADALAGAPLSARERAPILLTHPTELSAATRAWLEARAATLADGHVFGAVGAVSDEVAAAATLAARTEDEDPVTAAGT